MLSMNRAPSGTMSGVEAGRASSPLAVRSRSAPFCDPVTRGACAVVRRWLALIAEDYPSPQQDGLTGLALASMMSGPVKSDATAGTRWRIWRAFAAKHALKERGGLNELARAREACRLPNDVLVQHRRHRVLSARTALTAGLACNAPSTETEAMVARASSGVTSCEMLASPRTLMCSISPARCTASRSSRL